MRSLFAFVPLVIVAFVLPACSSGSMPPGVPPATSQSAQTSDVPQDSQHIFYPMVGQERLSTQRRLVNPNLNYYGGPVMNDPKIYVVYWQWKSDPSGEQAYLNAFFSGIGSGAEPPPTQGLAWLNVTTQYYSTANRAEQPITDPSSQLGGTWNDDVNSIPPRPNDRAIASEAVRAAAHFGISGNNVMVMVATPHGNSTRGFATQWCAYHSSTTTAGGPLAYTNLPYMTDAGAACGANFVNGGSAGLLDGVSIVGGHEYAESITDPYPSSGWLDAGGDELADKCAWSSLSTNVTLSTGTFAVQPLWSNAISGCATSFGYP